MGLTVRETAETVRSSSISGFRRVPSVKYWADIAEMFRRFD